MPVFLPRRSLILGALAALGCGKVDVAPTAAVTRKKRVLILGGTQFLGPEIVEIALARGHTVTLFNRARRTRSSFLAWKSSTETERPATSRH